MSLMYGKRMELPDMSWDIYISSGGPGDPLESEGLDMGHIYILNGLKTNRKLE